MDLVNLLIYLVIVGLVMYVIWWAINQLPLPEPIRTVIRVVMILIIVVVLLKVLLPMVSINVL